MNNTHYQVIMGSYTVNEFVKQIDTNNNNKMIIAPFQRAYKWHKTDNPLYFLDSLQRNIFVLPVILVSCNRETWIIDGQQRIATIYCYMKGLVPKEKEIRWDILINEIKKIDKIKCDTKKNKAIENSNILEPCVWEKLNETEGGSFIKDNIGETPIGYSLLFNIDTNEGGAILTSIFDRINNQGIKTTAMDTFRVYTWSNKFLRDDFLTIFANIPSHQANSKIRNHKRNIYINKNSKKLQQNKAIITPSFDYFERETILYYIAYAELCKDIEVSFYPSDGFNEDMPYSLIEYGIYLSSLNKDKNYFDKYKCKIKSIVDAVKEHIYHGLDAMYDATSECYKDNTEETIIHYGEVSLCNIVSSIFPYCEMLIFIPMIRLFLNDDIEDFNIIFDEKFQSKYFMEVHTYILKITCDMLTEDDKNKLEVLSEAYRAILVDDKGHLHISKDDVNTYLDTCKRSISHGAKIGKNYVSHSKDGYLYFEKQNSYSRLSIKIKDLSKFILNIIRDIKNEK